ncbi:hypothetical protein [Streptomyces boninensis]|uniref:hypothetical protein n=1 Tax=Streptomyces boninensis TaxID=2039455 RepID=UPI003B226658
MLLEAMIAAVLGLAASLAALRRRPARFRHRRLTLATGPAGAVLGAVLFDTATGGGPLWATSLSALAFAAALLSLLVTEGVRAPRPIRAR